MTESNKKQENNSNAKSFNQRHPYSAPKILSAERLEAAAAACDPAAGGFGKTQPIPCTTLGS